MSETSLNNQSFRGKVLKDPQEAWQLFDLIRKIAADAASNKVQNTEDYVKVLLEILNDTFVVYVFEDVPDPQTTPSNDIGNIYDVGIGSDGSIWFKKLQGGWSLVFKPLPRFKAYKSESEDTNDFPESNEGDLVFTLKGSVYQKEESGWENIHTPIQLRVKGVIDHQSLIPTFGNDNDIAIDKLLKVYQKQDGAWVEILTLNTYTREEIDQQLQNLLDVIGDLDDLDTTDQSTIVNAINELVGRLDSLTDEDIALTNTHTYLGLDSTNNQDDFNEAIVTKLSDLDDYAHQLIDDSLTTGTENTWSISKIVVELGVLQAAIQVVLDAYGLRLDELELQQEKRVAVNQEQTFTEAEKEQGRENIDVYSIDEVDTAVEQAANNSVSYVDDQSGTKTELEKERARTNIDVHKKEYIDDKLTDIYVKIGDISVLDPDIDQTGLAEAIQSVFVDLIALKDYAEALIDDTASTGVTDKTFSANQILDLILHLKQDILGGASGAYDTLLELQQAIQDNDTDLTTLLTEQGKRVAVFSQTFTMGEKAIARANISVYSDQEIDTLILDAVTDIMSKLDKRVAVDQVQPFTNPEKQQGRDNLDVYSKDEIGDITTDLAAYFTQQINNL